MNIDRFLSWFNSTGVNTDDVNVHYSGECGFGLYARRSLILKDILILSIPENLFLKPSNENNYLTGFEHLIISLLENVTHPYIQFLRTIESIPSWLHFSDQKYPRQLMDQMKKHLNKYNRSRNKLEQYNDKDFQWAYYTINTRCVHFNMEIDSKDQDDNLSLIPFLDFVNHSIDPNTISKFNPATRSYEIRTIKSVDINEEITFLYNYHSNMDLFIEYGFVLSLNPYNQLNIQYELIELLSNEQIEIMKLYNYWNSLEFYSGDNDLSWTIIKAIEININQEKWLPYDHPSTEIQLQLINKIKLFLNIVQLNIEKDFQLWKTENFIIEKNILFNDFLIIIHDTSRIIDKSILDTYIFFHL